MRRTLFTLLFLGITCLWISCDNSDDTTTQDSPVVGNWRITAIQVSQQELTQFSPADEVINIELLPAGTFSGATSANQFSGRYELNGTTLTMLEFTTTEAADTPFAGAFYDAIIEAQIPMETFAQFSFSFENQDLILVFGNSGQMTLEALE